MTVWIVDGNNVVGARPDGWWLDRTAAMERLVHLLNAFHERTGEPVVVVFDGRSRDEVVASASDGVSVRFAPPRGEGDPADDEIARLVAADRSPGRITVVTSDRGLADRVGEEGARTLGAGAFRAELEDLAP